MNIQVNAKELSEALSRGVASKRGTLPILEHALLEVDGATLRVTTTDTRQTLTLLLPVGVDGYGAMECAAHAAKLKAALQGLSERVTLQCTGDVLTVIDGRRSFRIPTLPAADFPVADTLARTELEADAEALRTALQRVEYAAARNDVRYYLLGVYFESSCVVATDGVRIAVCPVNTGIAAGDEVIIPIDCMKTVIGFLADGTKMALLRNQDGRPQAVEFANARGTLRTPLIDGRYPHWRNTAPPIDKFSGCARFEAKDALLAVTRVMAFSDTGKGSYADMTATDALRVAPTYNDAAEDFIPCEINGGAPDASFNAALLHDVLEIAEGAKIAWYGNNHMSVQAFAIEGRADLHYIMPIRR